MAIFRLVKGKIIDVDFTKNATRLVKGKIIVGQAAVGGATSKLVVLNRRRGI